MSKADSELKAESSLPEQIESMDVNQLRALLGQVQRQLSQVSVQASAQAASKQTVHISIPSFSGDDAKGEITYRQWKYDVRCLINDDHSQAAIRHAIRRSLRGTAAEILPNLGEQISIDNILDKFDVIFGNVLTSEQLYQQFYSSQQRHGESVATWGCRLEKLVNQLKEECNLDAIVAGNMLRTRFWMGLSGDGLRNSTRHHFDSGLSYANLFKWVKSAEHELSQSRDMASPPSQPRAKTAAQPLNTDGKIDSLTDQMSKLTTQMETFNVLVSKIDKRVSKLESNKQPASKRGGKLSPQKKVPSCDRCGRRGHKVADCVAKMHVKGFPLKGQAPTPEGRQ